MGGQGTSSATPTPAIVRIVCRASILVLPVRKQFILLRLRMRSQVLLLRKGRVNIGCDSVFPGQAIVPHRLRERRCLSLYYRRERAPLVGNYSASEDDRD